MKTKHTPIPGPEAVIADCFGLYIVLSALSSRVQLLGFAIVQQIIDEATLLDICVAPAYQGLGFGLLLIRHLLSEAKQAQAVVMMLEVRESNTSAKGLYEKVGFSESGRRKNYYQTNNGNEDAILMDKPL
ncbi:ribosomal protein S18-alanine N-acetyltransferase [Shewanella phaeophyticola]|uniref:[Ribosomal protein bS18]-alanine N-acetyltransferase n=1 Tax=Shewanella phaeophyticola TaxID=2978345 RepID=A0ABT2NYL8_9GAMM|nr:ribosomal protein S18-alanine N-acetyltransferase [Shewanella sp. KJ10-1]MCT8985497.1 ribosomal protein S18-alanine N-acetyltransferase [Shewanella sp. KJ10-1]